MGQSGYLDSSFGTGGIVQTPDLWQVHGAVIQPNGDLVVGGGASADARFALVRYLPRGSLDPSFGVNGIALGDVAASTAHDLAVQPDGKLVVAGTQEAGRDPLSYFGSITRFALARFNPDGNLDRGFGNGGHVTASIGPDGFSYGSAVALQQDGNIVVAGQTSDGFEGGTSPLYKIGLARFQGSAPAAVPRPPSHTNEKKRPLLSKRAARSKAKAALRRRYGRTYRRGRRKRLACKRRSPSVFRCRYSFRYPKTRRAGIVVVRRTDLGIKASVRPSPRQARRK